MSRLDDLLVAPGPEALLLAVDRLGPLDERDDARIAGVLRDGADRLAVANLLQHPELVPGALRLPALLRAVRDGDDPRLALAACVGLQRLADDPLLDPSEDERVRAEVVAALERLVAPGAGAVADRAAVALHAWQRPGERGALPLLTALPSDEESTDPPLRL
jgi:hypothetical protein